MHEMCQGYFLVSSILAAGTLGGEMPGSTYGAFETARSFHTGHDRRSGASWTWIDFEVV
jgi:hypothetical protein